MKWQHARLLITIFRYRVIRWLLALHAWVADHFIGFMITVFMGVIIPIGLVCVIFDWSPLLPQVLTLGVFVILGSLITLARRHARDPGDTAALAAEAAYKRYRLRRQYPGLEHAPDSMLDDVFQPVPQQTDGLDRFCVSGAR